MARREEILLHAKKLFNENGYPDVGVRELARLLGISPGNLSYHFSKKEDILLALLEEFSRRNSALYAAYNQSPPGVDGFLELMGQIFRNQYDYRGVFIGNQFVRRELLHQERFQYTEIAEKRISGFRNMYGALKEAGHLRLDEGDAEFLVSFTTLFGRFWISEATLLDRSPDKEETVNHYLALFARQLLLFATEQGKAAIHTFLMVNSR